MALPILEDLADALRENKALRADLEAATEGSRELDARLACAEEVHIRRFIGVDKLGRVQFEVDGIGHTVWRLLKDIPHYTTSLDAALTLTGDFWMSALLYALGRAAAFFVNFCDKNGHIMKKVILWCCIAALKDRAA